MFKSLTSTVHFKIRYYCRGMIFLPGCMYFTGKVKNNYT